MWKGPRLSVRSYPFVESFKRYVIPTLLASNHPPSLNASRLVLSATAAASVYGFHICPREPYKLMYLCMYYAVPEKRAVKEF